MELTDAGFQMTTDTLGDTHYVGRIGNIVWRFDEGTWRSNPDVQNESLGEYVDRMKAATAAML